MSTVHDVIRAIERRAAEMQQMLEVGTEKSRRFADICVEMKWPPPWHMPCTAIDRIADAYHAGRLTPDETAIIFASYYKADRIEEFRKRWLAFEWLSPRIPILEEALENRLAGRHYSAVCLLLPQIEGVLRETLGRNPTPSDIDGIIRGYHLATAAGTFYRDVVLESFDPASTAPIPDLSRHAILHGKAIDYGTTAHSLKVILITDIILSSIDESRKTST